MLTENEARDLLRKAGETIDVDPNTPVHITAAPRSRWLILGAAASVAAISVASWAVVSDDGAGPDRSGPTVSTPTDGVPEGSVPSVFGYDRETGTAFLESLGYQVQIEQKPHCDAPGRAIGTEPATGTPLEKGATVTLLVATTGATLDCAFLPPLDAWAFVDFANGHAAAPEFADSVTLVVDDGAPVTLSRAEAADPTKWGAPSALTELHEATQYVVQQTEDGETQYLIPGLGTRHGTPPDENCGVPRPNVVGDRGALTLTVDVATEVAVHCPTTVALYFTGDRIDTVVTYTEKPVAGVIAGLQVPDVAGLSLDKARAAVTAAGFTAVEEQLPTCSPASGVVEQAPVKGFTMAAGQTVTLVTEVLDPHRDCAGLLRSANGLVPYALGAGGALKTPLMAPEVDLYQGYKFQRTVSGTAAADPASWDVCDPDSKAVCPASVARTLAAHEGGIRYGTDIGPPWDCVEDLGGLPSGLSSENWMVMQPAEVGSCATHWVIQIWVDSQGRINAMNLMLPPR